MSNNQRVVEIRAEKAKINRRIKGRLSSNETDQRKLADLGRELSSLTDTGSPRKDYRTKVESWSLGALPYAFGALGLVIGLVVIVPIAGWIYSILPIAPTVRLWVTVGFVLLVIVIIITLVMAFASLGARINERKTEKESS